MFTVIRMGSTQYKVSLADVIDVPRISAEVGETIKVNDVLLVADEGKIKIGTPIVKGASVEAKIEAKYQGEKLDIRRFKSKVRERRHIGFRPQLTRLLITAIHA